jgi:glycosyltransferase involved in cell wall biosynthesis
VKICCIISSLAAGGAERVMSLLANEWAGRGRGVTVVTLDGTTIDAYQLDPRVARLRLDLEIESHSPAQAVIHNLLKIRGLRRAVASLAPDVVISFVDRANVLTLLSCMGLGVPVVISERVHPMYYDVGRLWSVLRRLTYPRADALVVQSEAIRPWAERVVPARRIHVIPNPVGDQFSDEGGRGRSVRGPIVLAVGRLVPQKGFDLLIKAFHLVLQRHPEWSLMIVGCGSQEAELKRLAAELLPQGAVIFPGAVNDPERYYRAAGLLVVPSRFEGFPNVLVEAMACGCAVIATNCPGGTADIVGHDIDGLLIPPEDVEALARAMDRLIADGHERSRLGARAVEASSRFRIDKIMPLWDAVISQVRARRLGAA